MSSERLAQVKDHLRPVSTTFAQGLLAGQTGIVTGAGQGIGAETAILFAREGAKVVVADVDVPKAEAVAKRIVEAGGKAVAVGGDLMQPQTVDRVVNAAAELGSGKINFVINNAVLPPPPPDPSSPWANCGGERASPGTR